MSPLLLLLAAQAATVTPAPYTATPVPDPALADQRGGFRLPNGVDVALTVETQTAINGAVVLKTVFRADQGPPTLTAYVPKAGTTVAAGNSSGTGGATTGTTTAPQISFDGRGGVSVTPGVSTALGVSAAKGAASAVQDGLEAVNGVANTVNGVVTQADAGAVKTVTLAGADLSVTHLAGNAFGSAVANSASDRVIDSTTSVSIDLANAGPDVVGSAMLRVESVALDAVGMRTP